VSTRAEVTQALLRELLTGERHAVLATLSASRDGWPFASVAPYAVSTDGEPLLLLSDLAEHTRNVRVDPRASLLVQDGASRSDPQAGRRVTILGQVEPVPETELETARHKYVARHAQAAEYLTMGDFRLYVLRVREARFIGGFGDMGWLDAATLRAAAS
jgi:putative heme iron utilization protein